MDVVRTALPGVLIVEPKVHSDERGEFFETYHADRYRLADVAPHFVQDNQSGSVAGTLRGLHYQLLQPQGKLVRVVRGAIFDVVADIRSGSPSFGQWVGIEVSAANRRQVYVPPGFAHGFCVPDEWTEVEYKCTDYYRPDDQRGVRWNDATLNIAWPVREPIVSAQDRALQPLSAIRTDLPRFVHDAT